MTQNNNSDQHIYTPDRAVDNTLALIEGRLSAPQIVVNPNIPGLGDILNPWRAGELISIVGYTSNGKTSLFNYIATQHAHKIRSLREGNPGYNHVIVFVTWEQAIEEQTVIDLSRVTAIPASKIFKGELKEMELALIKGAGATARRKLPIWLIGHSVLDDRRRPRLSIDDVNEMLVRIEGNFGQIIDLIGLDYLQRIRRTAKSGEMREGYMDIVDGSKDMALRCPVILLGQAKREVLHQQFPLPSLDDGQETSNLEQSSDCYLSVMMPKQKGPIGKPFGYRGRDYIITDKLMFLGVLKQKMGLAPIIRAYEIEYGGTDMKEAFSVPTPKKEGQNSK